VKIDRGWLKDEVPRLTLVFAAAFDPNPTGRRSASWPGPWVVIGGNGHLVTRMAQTLVSR